MLNGKALYYIGSSHNEIIKRKWIASCLLLSSFNIFHDSKLIRKLEHLKSNFGNDDESFTKFSKILFTIKSPIVDITKICICFENYFKVELLLKGYIIHKIDWNNKKYQSLSKKQKEQPIKISELKKAEGFIGRKSHIYDFDSLLETTIGFNTLLSKPDYKIQLRFPVRLFQILERVNRKRNTLHFLLDTTYSFSENVLDDYIYLNNIVNNRLARKYELLSKSCGLCERLIKKT
jgi:hypothetical protein